MKPSIVPRVLGAITLSAFASFSCAESLAITLPVETVRLRSSELPGYALAAQKCGTCHSADYIEYQPPGMSEAQWTAVTRKMQKAFGASLSDDEVTQIGRYLAVAYAAQPGSSQTPPQPDALLDADALLTRNSCLSCHAIDKKIVGPAFQDIAARYRTLDNAQGALMESISSGSTGRWGTLPMPPFPDLKPDELKTLAEFVSKQSSE
ncbi:Cytochrome c-551 [compost metagenome]